MNYLLPKGGYYWMSGNSNIDSVIKEVVKLMESLKKFGEKHGYRMAYIISIVLIAIACLWNIGIQDRIKVVDDEFAYWGIAAQFAGYDWSDLMAVTGYYSYGYSLILVPLYLLGRLGLSAVLMYKAAIVLNGIFLILSFVLTVYVGKRIFPELNKYYLLAAGLVTTLYLSNIDQAGCAWTEVYLYFMFWCVTACMLNFMEKQTIGNILLLLLTTANIFAIHMRAVGVVIAVIIVFMLKVIIEHKKVTKKQIIITLVAAVILTAAVLAVKDYVTNTIYMNNGKLEINDFSGQTAKIKNLLSITGVVDFILSILGKLYYLGTSSYLFVFIGFAVTAGNFIRSSLVSIKGKKILINEKDLFLLFIILAFLGEIAVAAMFKTFKYYSMQDMSAYADTVVYGRYTDFIVGPLLLIGFSVLPNIKRYLKEIIISILALIACSVAVQHQFNIMLSNHAELILRGSAVAGISYMFDGQFINSAYYAAIIAISVFWAAAILSLLGGGKRFMVIIKYGGLFLIGIVWCVIGINSAKDMVVGKSHKEKTVESIASLIENTSKDTAIYYVSEGGAVHGDAKILQWSCPGRLIDIIGPDDLVTGKLSEECIFLCDSEDYLLTAAISDTKNYIYDSGSMCVFTEPGSVIETELMNVVAEARSSADPKKGRADLSMMLTELSYQKYNGCIYYNYNKAEGYLTGRTHLLLADGIYEFMVDMEISGYDGSGDIGYITVTNTEGTYLDTRILVPEDFQSNGRGRISVQLEVENYEEPVIGVYTYTNCAMKIYGIEYCQVKGNILAGREEEDSFIKFGQLINLFYEEGKYPVCYVDSDSSGVNGFPDVSQIEGYFPEGISEYIPGRLVPYRNYISDRYLIVENSDNYQTLFALLSNYMVIAKSDNYTLMIPQTAEMQNKAGQEGIEILANKNDAIDIRYFYTDSYYNIPYNNMEKFKLPKGHYEVSVEFEVGNAEGQDIASLYMNGSKYKINNDMINNDKYHGVYGLYLKEDMEDAEIGLFINSAVELMDEKVGIKRVDKDYTEEIPLEEMICINATCYEDKIVKIIEKDSQIISPDILLEPGAYEIAVNGTWSEINGGNMGFVEVFRKGELREKIPLKVEGAGSGQTVFTYEINEYELCDWYFKINTEAGSELQIKAIKLINH